MPRIEPAHVTALARRVLLALALFAACSLAACLGPGLEPPKGSSNRGAPPALDPLAPMRPSSGDGNFGNPGSAGTPGATPPHGPTVPTDPMTEGPTPTMPPAGEPADRADEDAGVDLPESP